VSAGTGADVVVLKELQAEDWVFLKEKALEFPGRKLLWSRQG
jgi:hypothetical protein